MNVDEEDGFEEVVVHPREAGLAEVGLAGERAGSVRQVERPLVEIAPVAQVLLSDALLRKGSGRVRG